MRRRGLAQPRGHRADFRIERLDLAVARFQEKIFLADFDAQSLQHRAEVLLQFFNGGFFRLLRLVFLSPLFFE